MILKIPQLLCLDLRKTTEIVPKIASRCGENQITAWTKNICTAALLPLYPMIHESQTPRAAHIQQTLIRYSDFRTPNPHDRPLDARLSGPVDVIAVFDSYTLRLGNVSELDQRCDQKRAYHMIDLVHSNQPRSKFELLKGQPIVLQFRQSDIPCYF